MLNQLQTKALAKKWSRVKKAKQKLISRYNQVWELHIERDLPAYYYIKFPTMAIRFDKLPTSEELSDVISRQPRPSKIYIYHLVYNKEGKARQARDYTVELKYGELGFSFPKLKELPEEECENLFKN